MHGWRENSITSGVQDSVRSGINFGVLSSYVDFNHYNLWIPADVWQNDASSGTVMSNVNGSPVRVYENGKTSTTLYSFRRPRMWINGIISIRLHYTGSVSSTNGFYIGCGIQVGTKDAAISTVAVTDAALSGPSTAGFHLINSGFETSASTNAFTQTDYSYDLVTVTIRRSGAHISDTNTGEFQLIGAEVSYRELSTKPVGRRNDTDGRVASKP